MGARASAPPIVSVGGVVSSTGPPGIVMAELPAPAWRFQHTWTDVAPVAARLESWGGRLIVSMPRTGSTLLGAVMLLAGNEDERAFERYIHEPVAPVYWDNAPPGQVLVGAGGAGPADVMQESAYQFASAEMASMFLDAVRGPVVFTMRDPRLSWPSRWRLMFREWLVTDPADPAADRIRQALEDDDFSSVGDILLRRVPQPDHGLGAFLALLQDCDRRGVPVIVLDNRRFRDDPRRGLRRICEGWGVRYHEGMVAWHDLGETLDRVVMTDLGRREYSSYYAATLGSIGGIAPETRAPLPLERFPEELRDERVAPVTIDAAVAWHEALLARSDAI